MSLETGPARRLEPAAGLIAGALLITAVTLPPETHPWSRAVCQMLGAVAALVLAFSSRRPRVMPCWGLPLVALAVVSITSAACRARAIDEAADGLLLIVAGALGRRLSGEERARRLTMTVLVALGAGVALKALLQHYVNYPAAARALRAGGGPGSAAVLGLLESGRPTGPFILPAALGGFLALGLPLALAVARLAPLRWQRRAALLAGLLEIQALVLTRSFGAVVALVAGLLLAVILVRPRWGGAAGITIVVLGLAGAGLFLAARRPEITGAGNDPLTLRAGNWSAAASMIRDHPLFGAGPGSFASFYPRTMQPGMNETRYAHNSYLQAAAGWGLWILLPLAALAASFVRREPGAPRPSGTGFALIAGAGAFLVHNLGDFTAYLPGVAIPSSVVLGMALGAARCHGQPSARAPARGAFRVAALVALAVLYAGHAIGLARSRTLLEAALAESERGEIERAIETARRAAALRPGDPEPQAFLAQMILAHCRQDPARMAEGERASERALAADPEWAALHYTRALYYEAAGEAAPAYREIDAAHRLYPLKPLYRLPAFRKEETAR